LQAAVDTVVDAAATFGADYPALFAEIRRSSPLVGGSGQ
jgi:hypothetical protein